jgi:tetratricopeptide (TPR) repeat protein
LATTPDDIPALIEYAVAIQRAGAPIEEAERALVHAGEVDPQNLEVRTKLGVLYSRWGKSRQVIETLAQLPESAQTEAVLTLLGEAYRIVGDNDNAMRALRESIALNPSNDEAFVAIATILLDSDVAAAVEHARRAVDLDGSSSLAHQALAKAYWKQGDLKSAEAELALAISLRPDDPWNLAYMGQLLRITDRPEGAIEAFQRAIELDHLNPLHHRCLGDAYSTLEDWPAAEASYRRAVELDPFDTDTSLEFGLMLAEVGRDTEARGYLGRLLQLDPDHKQRRRAEAALAQLDKTRL